MSWLKFGKKKYAVIEHRQLDDGELTDEIVRTNLSMAAAEAQVTELRELDSLFDCVLDFNYSIVEMGALHND